ncbi:fimbria/pilus outer membrane usher protein [Xylophilus rhododendri]|uniref:Fimbria/pilus outer membrane usher protein n=1 Tax=Xylophilus rhododendri TaxID=2697032 RepID=A0A857J4E0_9BURK|nr:fimbria/pilus outer membrane usher protein [Xylophilus rhododendri]QHI98830.1 fimbria/pilus outer membrane usher protein [Xylophilus rhododendri]
MLRARIVTPLAGCMALCLAPCVAAPAAAPVELLLAVRLNQVDTGETALLLQEPDGRLLVRDADLRRWRLLVPDAPAQQQDGQAFHHLDDIAGASWQLDAASQTLSLQADAARFESTTLNLDRRDSVLPGPIATGMFLNYDLSATRAGQQKQGGALLELGSFQPAGVGLGSFAVRSGDLAGPRLLRLETTWTHDLPARRASLRLGDMVGRGGAWGLPVRMGGVQWATNFDTQPGFVTFAMPTLSGQAALPSTVDLYVNDALQARQDIPAGPFSLQQAPVLTGQGEARMVVRDLLGREQTIVTPYYASTRLLRAGLHDFSYELGRVRQDFTLASNHYGAAALALTHRLGLSDELTVEARGEWQAAHRGAGLGAAWAWPGGGTVHGALAASRGEPGGGYLLAIGAERQTRRFGAGVDLQWTTPGFGQLGQLPEQRAMRQRVQAYTNLALGHGSFSLGYALQTPRDREAVRLWSAGYGVSLGPLGFLALSLLRSAGPQGRTVATLSYTRVLDGQSMNASAIAQDGGAQGLLQWQRSAPAGVGTGYRMRAYSGQDPRVEAGTTVQRDAGTLLLDGALGSGQTAVRASANGGVVWMGGGLRLARQLDSGFALVEVPHQAGVGVYADNQLVAHTDADGMALLPRLRAYQRNPVRIEQADLPLDAQIGSLQMQALPAFRSGTVLRFPVRRMRGATLTVTRADGQPLPAGASAGLDGLPGVFPFGDEGRLYLEGLEDRNRVHVQGPGVDCVFDLSLPADSGPVPELGVYRCLAPVP